jgi:hypothetical protein
MTESPSSLQKERDGWVAGTQQKPNSAKFNLFENRQNSSPDSHPHRPNNTMLYKLVQILRKTQKEKNKDSKEEEQQQQHRSLKNHVQHR